MGDTMRPLVESEEIKARELMEYICSESELRTENTKGRMTWMS